jgi:hypothetical protein
MQRNYSKRDRAHSAADRYGRRQPRPALRKQGTRKGATLAAVKEAGR